MHYSLLHANRKAAVDRALNTTNRAQNPEATSDPPPAYSANIMQDADPEYEEDPLKSDRQNTTVKLSARTTIRGSNNIIAGPLLDSNRITSLINAALNPVANPALTSSNRHIVELGLMESGNINLELDCDVDISGENNIIGLPPNLAQLCMAVANNGGGLSSPTVGGAEQSNKRKADEEPEDGHNSKKARVPSPSSGNSS
ncbi:hypothetical protein BDY21DRAFT_334037 [Lineolata rhizophorae]|uniref:Uncharacterized protein n=1 Tax=Lineolata rhizophorae TaxID=578093 RepID=A0A6A6PAP2_9PEZI|nr:hypothetical protein BDY21DRAFT_334037 [Lineolata rhizophorae]